LVPNASDPAVLLSEACAALMLADAGFIVEMRENPELSLELQGETAFAEVKLELHDVYPNTLELSNRLGHTR
jgi:hypothetical protein